MDKEKTLAEAKDKIARKMGYTSSSEMLKDVGTFSIKQFVQWNHDSAICYGDMLLEQYKKEQEASQGSLERPGEQ